MRSLPARRQPTVSGSGHRHDGAVGGQIRVRQSVGVLEDAFRWRQVVRRYAELRDLTGGMTPQERGRLFNGVIAELLGAFGIAAMSNQRGVGETDVTFSHGGQRFILEAKWERSKTGTGPIAKLQRRLEQRMVGVTGVFLAMNGYTADALAEIDKGRRLDVLLLDQQHWEAMLSGIVPPAELLDLVTDAASFNGRAYTPLSTLVSHPDPVPEAVFDPTAGCDDLLLPDNGDAAASVVLSGLDSHHVDLTVQSGGTLLLAVDHGVLAVDPHTRQMHWATPVGNCTSPLGRPDGSVLARRGHGLSRYQHGTLAPVPHDSAEPVDGLLLPHPDGSVWCLPDGSTGSHAGLLQLDPNGDDQHWRALPATDARPVGATWLTATELLVAESSGLVTISSSGTPRHRIHLPRSDPVGLAGIDTSRFVTVHGDGSLLLTDIPTAQHLLLGRLRDRTYCGCGVDPHHNGALYLATRYDGGAGRSLVAVLRITLPHRWAPTAGSPTPATASAAPAAATPGATVNLTTSGTADAADAAQPAADNSAERRAAEQRHGSQDAQSLGMRLPMQAFEGLVAADFDLRRWLEPWRETWRLVVTGQAPAGTALPPWLPSLARFLGRYAAPAEALEGHFQPSAAYLIGFADGLRSTWDAAQRRHLVPRDVTTLSAWLREPTLTSRNLQTITDLRAAARGARGKALTRSARRVLLWITTVLAGVMALGAIGATASGGYRNQPVGVAIGVNIAFGLIFVVLLFFALSGPQQIRKRRNK